MVALSTACYGALFLGHVPLPAFAEELYRAGTWFAREGWIEETGVRGTVNKREANGSRPRSGAGRPERQCSELGCREPRRLARECL